MGAPSVSCSFGLEPEGIVLLAHEVLPSTGLLLRCARLLLQVVLGEAPEALVAVLVLKSRFWRMRR